ncbi:MAG: hypothetical protein P4L73_01885 [Caulobacteraceae bacterium]|nr:hypothetical protein [Caulobacteraceae bacterium]
MSNLDRALAEISAIRGQLARATEFRGYGPATFAITGFLAVLAALIQATWLKDPAGHPLAWLTLWIGVAAASAAIIGWEMVTRSRRMHSGLADEMIRTAVAQFLPAAAAGLLLTAVVARFAPQGLPLLPGLWQLLFSVGVFASCRFLPRSLVAVGVWYMAAGLVSLSRSGGPDAFSPWTMGVAFGVGQMLVAILLHRGLGDDHERG